MAHSGTPPQTVWMIGIGSSAGGLEALSSFLHELKPTDRAIFMIAQHLAPHSKSMMVELLSRQTQLPVHAATHQGELVPGHVYVIPPNLDAFFKGGKLQLVPAGEATRPKPSVDLFFNSLAENFGDQAVGIILSGTGTDGADGIRAIKENGGIILSQDNLSAKYDGMPKAAQGVSIMDKVLPADELGRSLFEILDGQTLQNENELSAGSPQLKEILKFLAEATQNDFSQYKPGTIIRRIQKRMAFVNTDVLEEYLSRLRSDPTEVQALAQEMLISVTSFFRDPEAFSGLTPLLRQLLDQKNNYSDELRVWVAGCATGEEAYTLAMIALDLIRNASKHTPVKIFATDLDLDAVSRARIGIYTSPEVQGIPREFLNRFFEEKNNHYEARKELRDSIVFARQNLIQNPPFVKVDLISCRNVLIYFDAKLQEKVFETFQYSLKPNGILFLGKSENAPSAFFEPIDKKAKIFKRLAIPAVRIPQIARYNPVLRSSLGSSPKPQANPVNQLDQWVVKQLIREYRLTGVVIDEEAVIHHSIGNMAKFIAFPVGTPDFRLTNLLPRSASIELSLLIRKCKKDQKPHASNPYDNTEKSHLRFSFIVRPLDSESDSSQALYLVSFESRSVKKPVRASHSRLTPDSDARALELQKELSTVKEHLQDLVGELEISNEELQSLNEEMSSTNEELQASNEELETTNEELQSSNEELVTVNEELNTKQSELKIANLSLESVQNSIAAPLIVVDNQLRVLSHNRDASKIFILGRSEIGKPITEVSCQTEIADFDTKLMDTVRTGVTNETFCETKGTLYQVRITPNYDENAKPSGAVIIFFDNTEIIRAKEKLRISDVTTRTIIDGTPALISLKDMMGNYLIVNRAFQERYGISEQSLIGKSDREIFANETANLIRERDLEVFVRQDTSECEEKVTHNGRTYTYYTSRFPMDNTDNVLPKVLGTVSLDISAQVTAQDALRASEAQYRAIVEDQAVLVCRHLPDGKITFVNSAFCHTLGGTAVSNLNRTFQSFIERPDHTKVDREIAALTVEHSVRQYETQVRIQQSPAPRWIRWIHRVIVNDDLMPVEYQAVGFDVTELHHQTNYLLQQETLFTHLLEHTSDYLTVYKVTGKSFVLESFNPSAAKSRSDQHHHLVGKTLDQLTSPKNKKLVLEKYEECVQHESVVTFEEEIESPRGSIFVLTSLVPIMNRDNVTERIAALGRDITHLKRVEQALREQTRSSDAASQAKSDFLAAMSHELRTPLGVISGMTQLMARDQLNGNQKKYVSTIQNSTKTLLALIEDVLDLSKIESGKMSLEERPFGLDRLLEEIAQTFELQAKQKNLQFVRDFLQKEDLILQGDQTRLRQVLMNLLGNAIKFTADGKVSLRVESESIPTSAYQRLHFEVKDSGVGIAKESAHRIFSRFSQADSGISRKFGGTGLGLAISKQIVELMGGEIGFDSNENEGSRFWFTVELPLSRDHIVIKENPQENFDLSELRILAVDDNAESLHLMELFLQNRVKKVLTASSAQAGIKILEENPVDLVIMDVQMPKVNGMQATEIIRNLKSSEKSKVPVLAVTANAMTGDKERFIASGMNDYISKPIDFPKLFERIYHWSKQRHDS